MICSGFVQHCDCSWQAPGVNPSPSDGELAAHFALPPLEEPLVELLLLGGTHIVS